ncbi:MAG TPA: hypothetical protein VGL22_01950 [Terracidiphilus sp.]|jgi:hypothetical protein
MRRAGVAALLGAAIVLSIAACVGFHMHSLGSLGQSEDFPSQADIQRLAGLPVPRDALNVRARIDLVITKRTLYLRFSLSPEDTQAFLDGLQADSLTSTSISRDLLSSERPRWFAPETATRYRAAELPRRAILVDETDPALYTVYLKARG